MDNIEFGWDEEKAEANHLNHGVTFETAVRVFADPFHVTRQDRIEGGEYRWQTIGMVDAVKLLLVAHTWTGENGVEYVRIISARAATRRERRNHENGAS